MIAAAVALCAALGASPNVGDWVTYRLKGGTDARTHFWRFAVVGRERDVAGRPAWWVEAELSQHASMRAPLLQARLLVAPAQGASAPHVSRAFVAWGMEPSRELSPAAVAELFGGGTGPPKRRPARRGTAGAAGVEVRRHAPRKLMTAAGTIEAAATEARAGAVVLQRIWVSKDVPLLGLARLEIPAIAHEIDVHAFGRDAVARMALPERSAPAIALEPGRVPASTLAPLQEGMQALSRADGALDAP